MRVIGVVSDFRQHGEFSTLDNYAFRRNNSRTRHRKWGCRTGVIKVKPGTTVVFEEQLTRQLQAMARDWSFDIKPRRRHARGHLAAVSGPCTGAGTIACFLLLMVALGLTGVVWQNVTQRVREIGLRRAKGARIEDIHRQILGELAVMTSFALIVAVALVAQTAAAAAAGRVRDDQRQRVRGQHRDFRADHLRAYDWVRLVSRATGDANPAGRGAALRIAPDRA